MALIEVRLRPAGPWRVGHHAGDRERVDVVYHSDALFSAITHGMRALGWLEEWLDATARAASAPAVRFSSLFPFMGRTRLISPPKSAWPPANPGKLYLQGTRLVPLEVARNGVTDESRWSVDGGGECLVPAGAGFPFQASMRSAAAVDRITGAAEPHRVACLEFASNAGWWGVFEVADKVWEGRVKSAFRLLADSGFGGERSRGWGRAGQPEFSDASGLFPRESASGMWWLLSLYSPAESDAVDWSRGEFTAAVRGGWTDSPSGAGAKKQVRMIEEGSVLSADALRGRTVDVAPDGFAHPVYRSGFALAVPLPEKVVSPAPVEAAPEEENTAALPASAEDATGGGPVAAVEEPATPVAPVDETSENGTASGPATPVEESAEDATADRPEVPVQEPAEDATAGGPVAPVEESAEDVTGDGLEAPVEEPAAPVAPVEEPGEDAPGGVEPVPPMEEPHERGSGPSEEEEG